MTPSTASPRSRDRSATQALIIETARRQLADEGFQHFGVNAIARRGGFDKQLIYRYFGGLDGLVDAIGEHLAGWLVDRLPIEPVPTSYGALIERMALGYLEALRADPLVQRMVTWEISEATPYVRRLTEARSRALLQWGALAIGALRPPENVDAAAINGMIIAGVQHLVLAAATTGQFAGMPLAAEADWDRVKQAVIALTRGVYQASA
jgi:AcrR family transcriptional regulator